MSSVCFQNKEELAKFTIGYILAHRTRPHVRGEQVARDLKRKAACFVSVYVGGELRGCIGNATATGPLYQSIVENAAFAATQDYRFAPLSRHDLPRLTAEVSVLSPVRTYVPKSTQHLIEFLTEEKPGVMVEKESKRALFLPQVWESLPNPYDFLTNLCRKAGLPGTAWLKGTRYWIFTVS